MSAMQIPIENIYYLLAYAWNRLDERNRVSVSIDDKTRLVDLFAKILISATRILLKRGIDKSYVEETQFVSGVKGKLELAATLKSNLQTRLRAVCTFDEFSADVLTNRILVSTLRRLTATTNLDSDLKREIRKLLSMFGAIETVPLTPSTFARVRLNRNNRFYGFILDVCRIVAENILPGETAGEWKFVDFTRDERKMNKMFEKFTYNFYRIETAFEVKSETISWRFSGLSDDAERYLPAMITDVSLQNARRKIIIDAKFHRETLTENYGRTRIKSTNLYQLFSYLINQRNDADARTISAAGILLYPTIEKDYDLDFQFEKHRISIKTVNLNANWKSIERRLLEIVQSGI